MRSRSHRAGEPHPLWKSLGKCVLPDSSKGAIRLLKTMSFFRCIQLYVKTKGAESQVIARILLMESLPFVGSVSPVAIHLSRP